MDYRRWQFLIILNSVALVCSGQATAHQIQNDSFESGINPPASLVAAKVTVDPGSPSPASNKRVTENPILCFLGLCWNPWLPLEDLFMIPPHHASERSAPWMRQPQRPRRSRRGGGGGANTGGTNLPRIGSTRDGSEIDEVFGPALLSWLRHIEHSASGDPGNETARAKEFSEIRRLPMTESGPAAIVAGDIHDLRGRSDANLPGHGIVLEKEPVWVPSRVPEIATMIFTTMMTASERSGEESADANRAVTIHRNPAPGGLILGGLAILAAVYHRRIRCAPEISRLATRDHG